MFPHDTRTGEAAPSQCAVFASRAPSLMTFHGRRIIQFRDGRYRTSEPGEIAFLCALVRSEARSNRGVWIEQLPLDAVVDAPTAVSPPKSPRTSSRKGR